MAFGFSQKSISSGNSGGVRAATTQSKKVPKSVQDIIDKAGASAWAAANNYAQAEPAPYNPSSAPTNNPTQTITPTTQTPGYSQATATGAGFGVGPQAYSGGFDASGNATVGGPYASGGSAGGSATVGSLNPDGTNKYTGFASMFAPGALQDQIWNDPQLVLNAMFQQQGINQGSPLYSVLRSLNGADPMSLDLLLNPGQTAAQIGDAGTYANFLHSMYGNQMAAGGRTPNFGEMLSNLMSVGDQSKTDPQNQSSLYQQLVQGGAPEQFRTFYGLASDAAKMGLAPNIGSAFLDALARQGDQYLTSTAQGNTTPYYQYASNPMVR